MTGTSEISDKLTAALEARRARIDAEVAALRLVAAESIAVETLVAAAEGRRFTRDGMTYVAYRSINGMWSLREPRVQKGVEA